MAAQKRSNKGKELEGGRMGERSGDQKGERGNECSDGSAVHRGKDRGLELKAKFRGVGCPSGTTKKKEAKKDYGKHLERGFTKKGGASGMRALQRRKKKAITKGKKGENTKSRILMVNILAAHEGAYGTQKVQGDVRRPNGELTTKHQKDRCKETRLITSRRSHFKKKVKEP